MPSLRSGCQAEARGMLAQCLARTFPWHPEPVCPSWHGRVHVSCALLPSFIPSLFSRLVLPSWISSPVDRAVPYARRLLGWSRLFRPSLFRCAPLPGQHFVDFDFSLAEEDSVMWIIYIFIDDSEVISGSTWVEIKVKMCVFNDFCMVQVDKVLYWFM